LQNISKQYPNAKVIDVTSKAQEPWVKFSPFYPHGNIPVPFSAELYSWSVEGIWQGLKEFNSHGIDIKKFEVQNMKGIKRTLRKFGSISGHRKGVNGTELLSYKEAREQIYIPSYCYVLDNFLTDEIDLLINVLKTQDIVLLDYETNMDLDNLKKPLSHASLVARHIEHKNEATLNTP